MVTEECLLHPSRNPHYGKANIERVLKEYLGLEKVGPGASTVRVYTNDGGWLVCCLLVHALNGMGHGHAVHCSALTRRCCCRSRYLCLDHLAVEGRGGRRQRGQRPRRQLLLLHLPRGECRAVLLRAALRALPTIALCLMPCLCWTAQASTTPAAQFPLSVHRTRYSQVVALAWPNDNKDFKDPQWEISMDAYERLSNTTGARCPAVKAAGRGFSQCLLR